MDVAAACAAFVSVSEFESFSNGAAALRIPQSVASRRVAALEELLGGALLERSTRRVALTPLGRELLPRAAAVAAGPATLLAEAAEVLTRPTLLAVPELCDPLALARLALACRDAGEPVLTAATVRPARERLLAEGRVSFALEPAAPGELTWAVPLGVVSREPGARGVRYLDTLRPRRADRGPAPTLWLHPEDDVPHVRDHLVALRNSLGLGPAQLRTARDLPEALAGVLAGEDLLVASRRQADDLGLPWARIGELRLDRGYRLGAAQADAGARFLERCGALVADCLGAHGASGSGEGGR